MASSDGWKTRDSSPADRVEITFPSIRVRHAQGWADFAKRVRGRVEVKLHEVPEKLATRKAGKQGSGAFVLRKRVCSPAVPYVSAWILRTPRRGGGMNLVTDKTKKYEVGPADMA